MPIRRSSGSIAFIVAVAVGITAGAAAIAQPEATTAQAGEEPKPVLLKTVIHFAENAPPSGRVRRLFIGQRSLCRRARFEDEATHSAVIKRIDCGRRGRLAIRFTPSPDGRNKSSSWTLTEATGSFKDLKGGGTMFVRLAKHDPRAREIFTGTLR